MWPRFVCTESCQLCQVTLQQSDRGLLTRHTYKSCVTVEGEREDGDGVGVEERIGGWRVERVDRRGRLESGEERWKGQGSHPTGDVRLRAAGKQAVDDRRIEAASRRNGRGRTVDRRGAVEA